MSTRDVILTLALILGAGLVADIIAGVTRLPRMLLLLGAGAVLGPSVTGAIDVPLDSIAAQLILTLGVSIILFHGALDLSFTVLSRVAVGLGLLAVPGVLVTAAIVGGVATAVFDVPLDIGLLIGAVLAPTDPAILIPLFERLGLRAKVSQTIIAESGFNDPIGAVLALSLVGFATGGAESVWEPVAEFAVELAISTGLGIVFGLLLSLVVSSHRAGIWRDSAALAVITVIAADYFVEDTAGGSGYLGVFVAGLIVGNMDRLRLGMHPEHEAEVRLIVDRLANVMVTLVFVTLGASLPFEDIADEWLPALAVVLSLMLVARPIVVALCLLPDRRARWTRNEGLFIAWTRETGVVPAALAGLILSRGVPDADLVVVCVSVAIVVTLLFQSTTKKALARRLGLIEIEFHDVPARE